MGEGVMFFLVWEEVLYLGFGYVYDGAMEYR